MSEEKPFRFWEQGPSVDRSKGGRPPLYEDPNDLWADACEYFEYVEANPLMEDKVVTAGGIATHEPVAKMRAMSLCGLCVFLKIAQDTFRNYRERDGFLEVTKMIDDILYSQKFEGASAGLLNANIIARDLGLADNVKNEHTGKNGGPIETRQVDLLTDEELEKELEDIEKAE